MFYTSGLNISKGHFEFFKGELLAEVYAVVLHSFSQSFVY